MSAFAFKEGGPQDVLTDEVMLDRVKTISDAVDGMNTLQMMQVFAFVSGQVFNELPMNKAALAYETFGKIMAYSLSHFMEKKHASVLGAAGIKDGQFQG